MQGRQSHRHREANYLDKVQSSTTHKPIGLYCQLRGYHYFYLIFQISIIISNDVKTVVIIVTEFILMGIYRSPAK
jgi:hypothetical protein